MRSDRTLLAVLGLAFVVCTCAAAAEYHVKLDGTADFESIQDAVDAAHDRDTIIVHPGTYYDNLVIGAKSFVLRSVNPGDWGTVTATVIDGALKDTVVRFQRKEDESVELSGLTIRNGRPYGIAGASVNHHIARCLVCENYSGDFPLEAAGVYDCQGEIEQCIIAYNHGGSGIAHCDGLIKDCLIINNGHSNYGGGINDCDGDIVNCLVAGNWADYGSGMAFCDGNIIGCTVTHNGESYGGGGLYSCSGLILNCIIWGNFKEWGGMDNLYGCSAPEYSCVGVPSWGDPPGPTNISADPLFTTGPYIGAPFNLPLGDFCLSSKAAGQDQDSPCIDAGSMSAVAASMADRTTRTDSSPDTGTVDIGFHYPTLLILPQVRVSTDRDSYLPGDTVEIRFEAANPNQYSYAVDVYAGILTANGELWTIDNAWTWSNVLNPWFASLTLPPDLTYGPTTLLTLTIPSDLPPVSDPGTYLVAAAFAHVGAISFLDDPSVCAFRIE